MGRWDYLVERKPQALKEYVLDQVADRLARDLQAWPPAIDEWLDEPLREKFRAAIERPSAPGLPTLRVACEVARRELLRDYDLIDAFWRSGSHRELLPDELEETTAHFVTRFLVDAALGFQELAQDKFNRRELVTLIEKVEDRLLRGQRFRL
ncbi:MAG TPA: hypothetical protein VG496_13635 [Myxococcales bacterium]|nr:hypothetical protein [Myxococcales bacterium]